MGKYILGGLAGLAALAFITFVVVFSVQYQGRLQLGAAPDVPELGTGIASSSLVSVGSSGSRIVATNTARTYLEIANDCGQPLYLNMMGTGQVYPTASPTPYSIVVPSSTSRTFGRDFVYTGAVYASTSVNTCARVLVSEE